MVKKETNRQLKGKEIGGKNGRKKKIKDLNTATVTISERICTFANGGKNLK